jgi:peptidyl-prolyl cis-trans isomerase A (cyclophilin A)
MLRIVALLTTFGLFAACSSSTSTPGATNPDAGLGDTDVDDAGTSEDSSTPRANPLPGCAEDPGPPTITVDANASSDPIGGADKFTIAQALEGYPESAGVLTALITTEKGNIRCELDEAAAPVSVANFVGLARGTRPFEKSGKWKVGRFYDGLIWHRVIPNFVIQGGDPLGTGTGGPGYDLIEENHIDEPAGTLAMAASSTPSGSQFYVVVGNGPAADYNVFGKCDLEAAIAIAGVERNSADKPKTAVHMSRIDIARCPK